MKNIKLILLALTAAFSCNRILEEELTGTLTADGVFVDEAGIDFALNGAYASMAMLIGGGNSARRGTSFETGWTLFTMGTDLYQNGSDGNYKSFNRYDAGLNPQSRIVSEPWNELYKGINATNTVIARAPDVLAGNTDKLNNILGQARFLRGYYYFILARTWGAVPYTDEETTTAETEATRMPLPELYPKIIEDLKFAEENLPSSQDEFGRVTSWAAKSALADVYLNTKDYNSAATYAEDVINNGTFSLVKPVADLWNVDNEQNSEVIWSVQFSNDLQLDNGGNPAHLFFLMEYDKLPGMKRDVVNGRPWKRFKPTEYLLELYDMEDQRYEASFTSVWYSNNPDSAPTGVKPGDTTIYLPRVAFTQAQKDGKPYGVNIFNRDELTEKIYPASKKWVQPNRASTNETSGGRDFIVYRLAEIYLIASEAHALKSVPNQTQALQYLNEVRKRGYGVTDVNVLPPISSVDINIILEERARELAQEGKRWHDLTRTGKLIERVKLHNAGAAPNIKDFHALRPIPQTQIDRTSNKFSQNPNY